MAGAFIIYILDFIVHRMAPDLPHEIDVADVAGVVEHSDVECHNNQGFALVAEKPVSHHQMNRTGILTAIALAMHNLPEGVATYTSAIGDLKVGIVLTIGISLHNIPEGIAVAIPVYYATGSRAKAFMWACASSLAEPLGALLAWLILGEGLNPAVEGVMFGLVAGMMVTLSIKELIPAAVKFCPDGHAVSLAILGGMAIMSSSLILFAYVGV